MNPSFLCVSLTHTYQFVSLLIKEIKKIVLKLSTAKVFMQSLLTLFGVINTVVQYHCICNVLTPTGTGIRNVSASYVKRKQYWRLELNNRKRFSQFPITERSKYMIFVLKVRKDNNLVFSCESGIAPFQVWYLKRFVWFSFSSILLVGRGSYPAVVFSSPH